jgi:UDP-N-acetylmuramoylalanine--D-glutamate ligase
MAVNKQYIAAGRALVMGLGSSGEAAASLLLRQGARVTVIDAQSNPSLETRATILRKAGACVTTGAGGIPDEAYDLAVLSPGIPVSAPWVMALQARGVPVISELELGWQACRSRVLAVTGSNGKSTLVKFCRESLVKSGLTAEAGGNFGRPLSALALLDPAPDWIVAEVSSFQLEAVDRFSPDVGILLNLNPNHLDRHGTMDVYTAMKARLFARQSAGQTAVLPWDAPEAVRVAVPSAARRVTFGLADASHYRYEKGAVTGGSGRVSLAGTIFDNEVMGVTAAACVAAMEGGGVPLGGVTAAAQAFERLPHRMQTVATVRGVTFIDDSKATNLAALSAGIHMAGAPVRLIAGGLLKETRLDSVKKILAKQVRGVYIIGKYSQLMASAWNECVPCTECGELREAVNRAWSEAQAGEVVLLSPGCASFDQFKSFEDRGEQFSGFVRDIQKGERDRE